ncbi:MAG TPA: hypothetical protein VEO94_01680, partial [Candidatus Dormibacteraeota bacterium]|nr:hypothetical protein [Candidatus Dormibacteraeota bacterium]
MIGLRFQVVALLVAAYAAPARVAAGAPAPAPAGAPLDCRLRCDFYKIGRSSTRVVVTLAAPAEQFQGEGDEAPGPDLSLSAALAGARSGKAAGSFATTLRPVAAAPGKPGTRLFFQGEFTIDPGSYQAVFTLLDRRSRRGATRTVTIVAPDFGRGLALSSLAIGRRAGAPGGTVVVPEPEAVFRDGETVAFAFEVYNAEHKGGATPDLDVQYEFLVDGDDGPRPTGRPVMLHRQGVESFEYSLPLQGWPEAPCRVRVRVTDNRTRAVAEREEAFRVVAPAGGGSEVESADRDRVKPPRAPGRLKEQRTSSQREEPPKG